jgi:hypothetical protein
MIGNPNNYVPHLVSGEVMIPQGIAADKIKGVVLFYDGTAFTKSNVTPSKQFNGSAAGLLQYFLHKVILPYCPMA